MKTDSISTERVEEFKYLGTTLTNKNSIQEEIRSRLKSLKFVFWEPSISMRTDNLYL
jgi:hypothetical protein